jgi:hypothetical protein
VGWLHSTPARRGLSALCLLALAGLWLHFAASLPATYPMRLNDFEGYYGAARVILDGAPERLYQDERKWFTNLPVVSLLVAPLGLLDYETAWRVFWWIQLASIAATFGVLLWILARHFPPLTPARALAAGAIFLCFAPVMRRALVLGQTTPLMTLLLALTLLLFRQGLHRSAGALLGFVCLIKIPPVLLVALFAARRRLAAAGAALVVLALGVLLSLLIFEPQLLGQYADRVIWDNLGRSQAAFNNRSLEGAWMRTLTWMSLVDYDPMPRPANVTAALAASVAGLAVLLGLRGGWALLWPAAAPRDDDPLTGSLELELALGAALMLLLFPVVWIHYFLFLAVPLSVLPFWWMQRRIPLRIVAVVLIAAGTWLASGTEVRGNHYYARHRDDGSFRLMQNAQTLGALLLALGLTSPLAEIARRERERGAGRR